MVAMTQLNKFLFDTSFDSEKERAAKERAAAEAAAAAEPPPPTFSEEELAAARQAAFSEGKAAGLAEAEASQNQRLIQAAEALEPQFATLKDDLAARSAEGERAALDAALSVVRKLFPRLAHENGLEEIRSVIETCLETLRDEPRLLIRCADQDLDAIKEQIEKSVARSGFEGRLVFLTDDAVSPGDVRAEWADGGAERDQAALWKEIDAVIERALTVPVPHEASRGEVGEHTAPTPQAAEAQPAPSPTAKTASLRQAQPA